MNSRCLLFALTAICVSPSLWATTYVYTGGPYTTSTNFTSPCGTGPCANFVLGQRVSGQFTTAVPLGPNLVSQNVFSSITSYSFADGISTYSSGNANSRIVQFRISTDAGGNITDSSISLELWQSGSSPHSVNDRVAWLPSGGTSGADITNNNDICALVGPSAFTGVTDTCQVINADPSSSSARASATGTWSTLVPPVQQQAIPTLSGWAMLLLSLLVIGFALRALSQRAMSNIA